MVAKQPAYKYRSLLDEPEITVTNPSGERVKHNKTVIHPATSFDNPPGSDSHTPVDSDTEQDLTDIKRAQKLSFAMTQIMGTPESHRTIQIITRGEYSKLVQEAEEEHRPPRKYLVATDLSDESTHALEWAIGTVLRDGDTLLAIYCVDEETGITDGTGASGQVPDELRALREQAAAINTITSSKTPITSSGTNLPLHSFRPLPLLPGGSQLGSDRGAGSVSASPAPSRERSKAEEERYRAVHDISERVTKLLRKTRLQVRVIVEVLHCKNPKHLITEVIDLVNPTLVILGSRGRSALKGYVSLVSSVFAVRACLPGGEGKLICGTRLSVLVSYSAPSRITLSPRARCPSWWRGSGCASRASSDACRRRTRSTISITRRPGAWRVRRLTRGLVRLGGHDEEKEGWRRRDGGCAGVFCSFCPLAPLCGGICGCFRCSAPSSGSGLRWVGGLMLLYKTATSPSGTA